MQVRKAAAEAERGSGVCFSASNFPLEIKRLALAPSLTDLLSLRHFNLLDLNFLHWFLK